MSCKKKSKYLKNQFFFPMDLMIQLMTLFSNMKAGILATVSY